MHRFVILLTILPLAALQAWASPALARSFKSEAASLHQETQNLMASEQNGKPAALAPNYTRRLIAFGRSAKDIGAWIDTQKGPLDLACIFRGMAREADAQLSAHRGAATPAARRQALARLVTLFEDAEDIADDAAALAPSSDPVMLACPADAERAAAWISAPVK